MSEPRLAIQRRQDRRAVPGIERVPAIRRVMLTGATGLVGRALMECCVGLGDVRLTAVARRRVELPRGARMEFFVAEPAHWGETIAALRPHVVVCALGTTWQKAGKDEEAFRAVDERLVLDVARAAKEAGARQFIALSSVGASMGSKSMYLRVKGEVEQKLMKLHFDRLDILRPGLLRGNRQDDPRMGEQLARVIAPVTDCFLHGGMRRYRSIPACRVAEAILGLTTERANGRFVHEYDAMQRAIRRFADWHEATSLSRGER
ncbi:MAG: NAD(P)H-binding protein [Novosphingobium sp.]